MKVYALGVIVEVGVPKTSQVSTKDEFLNEELRGFLRSLVQLDDMKIVYPEYQYGSATEINDFNYNVANQVEKSEKYRVFRFFRNTLYVTSAEELHLQDLHKLYWFRHKGILYCINISSLGSYEPKGDGPEYLGTSKYNSGEIVEKRVEQYSLF